MKKYYTVAFFVELDEVGYNNALNAFMLDCTSKLGWDLEVNMRRKDLRLFEVAIELDNEGIYKDNSAREALAYILNRGKCAFGQIAHSIRFMYRVKENGKIHYGELEYDRNGEKVTYDSWY